MPLSVGENHRNPLRSAFVLVACVAILVFAGLAVLLPHRWVSVYAQENTPIRRKCGTDPRYQLMLQQSTTFKTARLGILDFTISYARFRTKVRSTARGSLTIPVVVHVVYNTSEQNIADAQIASQMDALNRDYQLLNKDTISVPTAFKSVIGNPNLKFQLASKAPDGSVSTGVTRTKTNQTLFAWKGTSADWIKYTSHGGFDAWPRDKYLNIWVGPIDEVLGYASFPGEAAETDGVVISYLAFGTIGTAKTPFNLGRTTTHEVGHWLNLFHIWGDITGCKGSDQVDDTPTAADANYDKPKFPHISCPGEPNGDMFMNYMDYVDDDTMVMFTKGQIVRIDATLNGFRNAVVASKAQ